MVVLIAVVTDRIGKANQIQPVNRHPLAIVRRGQQSIHKFFVGSRTRIIDEAFYFCRCGWQSCQIETQPTDERDLIGLLGGLQIFCFQSRQDEVIDPVNGPTLIFDGWSFDWLWFYIRPVLRPGRTFRNPLSNQIDFSGFQLLPRICRGHDQIGILAGNSLEQYALIWLSGMDYR